MKVKIADKAALARLSLLDVRSYLESQRWRSERRYGNVANVYSAIGRDGETVELLLPLREDVADYAARMGDVVATLAEVEDRSEEAVYGDLVRSGFDVIRFRAPNADDAGTIDLGAGVVLYDQAKEALVAAANAAIKPRRAYRGNSSERAKSYLDSLRLGQTEIGSYVLTVLSPVQPTLESTEPTLFPDLEQGDDPFSRVVTRTLARSLSAAKFAVTEATATGKLDPFELAIELGVSANLCDAIARLAGEGNGIDISLTWSRVRRAPERNVRHFFTTDNARVLSEAATAFREREPQSDITIEGFVIGLERKPEEFDGKAKIRGFVEDRVRTLSAEFILPDYKKVVHAHERKLRVRVDGDLVRRGQMYYLESARNLIVVEGDEDFTGRWSGKL